MLPKETVMSVTASVTPLDSHWKPKGQKEDKKQYKEEFTYNGGLSTQIWRPKDNSGKFEFTEDKCILGNKEWERIPKKENSDPYLSALPNPQLVCVWKRDSSSEPSDPTTITTETTTTRSNGTVESCSCCSGVTTDHSEISASPAISVDHLFKKKVEITKNVDKSKRKKDKMEESDKSAVNMDSSSEKLTKCKPEVAKRVIADSDKKKKEKKKALEPAILVFTESEDEKAERAEDLSISMNSSRNSSKEVISQSSSSSADPAKTRAELKKIAEKSKKMMKKMVNTAKDRPHLNKTIEQPVSSSSPSPVVPKQKPIKSGSDSSFKKLVEKCRREAEKKDFPAKEPEEIKEKEEVAAKSDSAVFAGFKNFETLHTKLQPLAASRSSSYTRIDQIQRNKSRWSERKCWMLLVIFLVFVYFYRHHIMGQSCC